MSEIQETQTTAEADEAMANSESASPESAALESAGPEIRLGVSSCLLGEEVRYNGGHARNNFLIHELGPHVTWFPVCPEEEVGMGTPRETVRLVGIAESPRMVAPKSGADWTDRMNEYSARRVEEIEKLDLHGFVLKKNSPSCGLFRIKVYNEETGQPGTPGRGLFAMELTRRLPMLPVEEEGRLNDKRLRENFIERIFAFERWKRFLNESAGPGGLVAFHTSMKMTLLSHSPEHYKRLGQLTAEAGSRDFDDLVGEYAEVLAEGLAVLAKPGRHANVLHHLMGFLKQELPGDDKQELLGLIDDYRNGLVPLVVPVTLLRHHLRRQPVPEWVHQQVYLKPYPKELMLRNHV
jgi:uncharacterized protein YbgA (DUF1722 family)/uncharacterized protein YbbK (DUF523 family)